jgi:hypothetical protein
VKLLEKYNVVVELSIETGSELTTAVITVDPLLTPTILSLPVSIFKKAQRLVINVVTPLFVVKISNWNAYSC